MKLSVVMPTRDEEGCLEQTVRALHQCLREEEIEHEIVVVDDGSTDRTAEILKPLTDEIAELQPTRSGPPHGFGLAVREGLRSFTGDAVAIFMADMSDDPADLVRFFRKLEADATLDCVFGSRFSKGGHTFDYPWIKLALNRLANTFVRFLFGLRYNDTTNAFKLYRRRVIEGVQPLLSHHFNLTVEMPLKAIVRGYTHEVVANSWTNRTSGVSKLKIKEMGSRYLFIVLYCLLEKWLSRGDYMSRQLPAEPMKESKTNDTD